MENGWKRVILLTRLCSSFDTLLVLMHKFAICMLLFKILSWRIRRFRIPFDWTTIAWNNLEVSFALRKFQPTFNFTDSQFEKWLWLKSNSKLFFVQCPVIEFETEKKNKRKAIFDSKFIKYAATSARHQSYIRHLTYIHTRMCCLHCCYCYYVFVDLTCWNCSSTLESMHTIPRTITCNQCSVSWDRIHFILLFHFSKHSQTVNANRK